MIAVLVGDEDQVRRWQALEALGAAYRVDVDRHAIPAHRHRCVVDWLNVQVALAGLEDVAAYHAVRGL